MERQKVKQLNIKAKRYFMCKLLYVFQILIILFGTAKCENIISIQTNSAASGDTGKFSILIQNQVSVNGANFILQYDPRLITPVSIKAAGRISSLSGSTASMLGENKIAFILYDQGINYLTSDSGEIFEVEYVAKDSLYDSTSTELIFTEGIVADSSISVVPFEYMNGTLLISPLVGVKADQAELPREYQLFQNYPNPFNPITIVNYQLPFVSKVNFRIYNILGQEVKTIINEIQPAGFKSVVWNSTNNLGNTVASGIYFYRIEATSLNDPGKRFTQVKKMLLIR